MRQLFACVLIALSWGSAVLADPPAILLADSITYDAGTQRLIARGSVRVLEGRAVLQTEELIYDQSSDRLIIPGPLTLQTADGTVFVAETAELDTDLQNILIEGARSLIGQTLQVASGRAIRTDGRYTRLENTIASTCQVCNTRPTPTWQLRAESIILDEQEERLYFEGAVLDVLGMPILYLPYLSIPSPDVPRASGFLQPSFRSSDTIGLGVRIPYYWAIDQSRDATVTPYVTTQSGLLLDLEYRQRFASGTLDALGTVTWDSDLDQVRGFFDITGNFDLPNATDMVLELRGVTDDDFLDTYGYSDADRLRSQVRLERFGPDQYWSAGGAYYTSLRPTEPQETVPLILPDLEYRHILSRDALGGTLGVSASAVSLTRQVGVDQHRLSASMDWDRTFITSYGLSLRAFGELGGDIYRSFGTSGSSDFVTRIRPLMGVEARFPLYRQTGSSSQVIEPIAQIILADDSNQLADIPNEDSLQVDFDETNLFDTNRFPGLDRLEPGIRANLGLRFEHLAASGYSLSAAIGQVLRLEDAPIFASGSGLSQRQSDYILSLAYDSGQGLQVSGRILSDSNFEFSRAEGRLSWQGTRADLAGTYVFLEADPAANAPDDRAEIRLEGGYRIDDNWTVRLDLRRDIEQDRSIRTGGTLRWANECAAISFSVSRSYTRSNTMDTETEFGLNFELLGIGDSGQSARGPAQCGAFRAG